MAKKKTKKKKAKKNGRPTEYKKRYCSMLIKFFDVEPFEDVEIPHYEKSGKTYESGKEKGKPIVVWVDTKMVPNRRPTLRRFAHKIKVNIQTVYNWIDEKHNSFKPQFLGAFTRARELRKEFLVENGLLGLYPPSSFKFVATNETDMKDTQKQEITGTDGGPIPMRIVDFEKIDPNG